MTSIRAILLLCLTAAVTAQDRRIVPLAVERKQALIIANSGYPRAPLKNPVNDATAMEAALKKLGFEVLTFRDVDLAHMEAAIDQFSAGLTSRSLAFFYFSGHGVQVNFNNYLLPVDFAATSESDVKYKAYPAARLQEKLEESGARLRVLVLDACRNNPYHFKRDSMGGLASMAPNAEGTLIAFATGDGRTADDNPGEFNGLYTKHLIPAMLTPGLQLREVFQKTKEDVYIASRRMQNPSIYENVIGTFYLVGGPSPAPTLDAALEAWNMVKDSKDPEDFERFGHEFPGHELARTAAIRAAQLRRMGVVSTTPPIIREPPIIHDPVAGRTRVNPKDGLTYVWIPPGKFMMGCSPEDTNWNIDEKPAHEVEITKGFWMGETEVTQAAWQRVRGKNPSHFKGADLPVEQVNWKEAAGYCSAVGMRLPTEAEWEYAARAGNSSPQYGDLERVAWYTGNSGGKTRTVAGLGQAVVTSMLACGVPGSSFSLYFFFFSLFPFARRC